MMVFVPAKDRVAETSATNHASVWTVAGALDTSHYPFSQYMSVGDTTIGTIVEPGVAFATGILTYSATNQITLTTTFESKGTFGAGTKEICMGFAAKVVPFGRESIWLDARAAKKRTTNGPADDAQETTTNKNMWDGLGFDPSTIEYCQWRWRMPKQWDKSTITFVPVWRHPSTTTNFKVSWGLQAAAWADADAGDFAFGTAQYSNDTGGTIGAIYTGPESAAITVAGSPGNEEIVQFQALRKADDGTNDTLAVDAVLLGYVVHITTLSGNDA